MNVSPFHPDELEAQARAGQAAAGAGIRDFMPDQHRRFFGQLPFAVLGTHDRMGNPWAAIVSGAPGFVSSPDPKILQIGAYPLEGEPAAEGIALGKRIALLGIELPTRRRNRMNGIIVDLDVSGFTVAVEQSFGNCPQYIQRRDYGRRRPAWFPEIVPIAIDDGWAGEIIGRADTAFVASATPPGKAVRGGGVDVSHRGGRPGFIRVAPDGTLEIPDYRGNRYFSTLGNLATYPKAGLLIADFATGDLLQIAGAAEIVWEGRAFDNFPGAERLCRLRPSRALRLRGAFPLELGAPEFSPLLAETGQRN